MPTTISRNELRSKLDSDEHVVLIEALPEMFYRKVHLPGARNIPPDAVDELAPTMLPDSADEIVVYCMDQECPSSAAVAKRLEELGYTNVRHYEEGKQDWIDAGLVTESDTPVSGR